MKTVLSALFVLAFLGSAAIAASHGGSKEELQAMIDTQQLEIALPDELTEEQLSGIAEILAGAEDAESKAMLINALLGM